MKIAFLGTGLMGKPMAIQLIKAGHDVTIFNRTRRKTLVFKSMGVKVASTAQNAVTPAEVLITMLSDYQAIADVLLEDKSITFLDKNIIQMSTLSSLQSMKLKQIFEIRGAKYMEAPVLGSIPQANSRNLIVLFGGSEVQFRQWSPLLNCFGSTIQHIGPVGQAMSTKLALNQLIISLTTAFAMSLGFLEKSKISIDIFMNILRGSALYAPTFDKKLSRMLGRNFENPNFPVKHLLKDLNLIIDEFKARNIETGPLEKMTDILLQTKKAGFAEQDYSALYQTVNPS